MNETLCVLFVQMFFRILTTNLGYLNLQVPTFSFPRFIQLLGVSCYSKYVASGLVISIGGLQDSLRKASLGALMDYLQSAENQTDSIEQSLSKDIVWVLQMYKRCDRVTTPTLKVCLMIFFFFVFPQSIDAITAVTIPLFLSF